MVVLISLFAAGIKLPAPIDLARWRAPILLASVSMAVSVGLVAVFAYYMLGLPLGVGVLLGAILAPTDPVLATDVQTRHPGDRDPLRFTLTSEAGMNDGSAFPFVMLGLGLLGIHDLGEFSMRWVLVDVLWATAAGIGLGLASGRALAHMARRLRGPLPHHNLMDNFLGLGLIGVVYGLSLLAHAWGFLAVFFAAVSLRQTEFKLAVHPESPYRSDLGLIEPEAESVSPDDNSPASVSGGSLIFKEQLERLSEMMLVLLIGGTLFLDSWSLRAVGLALFLFLVARPVSVFIGMLGTQTSVTRYGGMVRRSRYWFSVLSDVCHPAWPIQRCRTGTGQPDTDRGNAIHCRPRHQCQTVDGPLSVSPRKFRFMRPRMKFRLSESEPTRNQPACPTNWHIPAGYCSITESLSWFALVLCKSCSSNFPATEASLWPTICLLYRMSPENTSG